ncbi:hypothetical protein IWQ56_005906, partial [Coemansia nantahalensis]
MRHRLSLLAALSLAIVASALEVDVGYNPEDIFQAKQESKDKFDEPFTFSHDSNMAMSHGYDSVLEDRSASEESSHEFACPVARAPAPYAQPPAYGPVAALVPGDIPVPQLVATLQQMMGYSSQAPVYSASQAPVYSASQAPSPPPPPHSCEPQPTTIICCTTTIIQPPKPEPSTHTVYVSIESHMVCKPTCQTVCCSSSECECEEEKPKPKPTHKRKRKHGKKSKKPECECSTVCVTSSEECPTPDPCEPTPECEPTTSECETTSDKCET